MNSLSINSDIRPLGRWMGGSEEFWVLEIDGKRLAESARPFAADDSEIVLFECEECYHCGLPEVLVRRLDPETVIWFPKIREGYTNRLEAGKSYLFAKADYDRLLSGDSSRLAFIGFDDFEHLFPWYTPHNPEDGLYTVPEIKKDRFGKRILKILDHNFRFGEFRWSAAPDEFRRLKIGLDQPRYPEIFIDFGVTETGMAFRFAQNPNIPIWMKLARNPFPFHGVFELTELE